MLDLKTRVAILVAVEIGKLGKEPNNQQVSLIRGKAWQLMLDNQVWPNGESHAQVEWFIHEAVKQLESR